MKFGSKEIKPIIRRSKPMTEEELNDAFAVGENTPLYAAIVQLLEEAAEQNAAMAAAATRENNAMAAAGHIVAWEELSGFLLDIETRRQENAD